MPSSLSPKSTTSSSSSKSRPSFIRSNSSPAIAPIPRNVIHSYAGWTLPPHPPTTMTPPPTSTSRFDFDTMQGGRNGGSESWSTRSTSSRASSSSDRDNSSSRHGVRFAPRVLIKKFPTDTALTISKPSILSLSINPLLALSPTSPHIAYDLGLPPSHQFPPHLHQKLNTELAITPGLPVVRIACELIPWPIDVHPSSPSSSPSSPNHMGGAVTCYDVLFTLYRNLQHRIRPEEWATRSPKQQDYITRSYVRRCHMAGSEGAEGEERMKGVRRVDWLMRQTVFVGLSPSYDKDETWVLTLGRH